VLGARAVRVSSWSNFATLSLAAGASWGSDAGSWGGLLCAACGFAAVFMAAEFAPSPKFIMGGSDEEKFHHPTQKPVDLMRRPILNHTKRGELVYEPFLGSGTTLATAELTERGCCGIELDPKYVDVIVQRWQTLSGKKAKLEGERRTFEEIAAERQKRAE
jgi:DNA modification methylase